MAPRISRLPGAKRTEVMVMGAAGVGALTPLYMMMPGAEERLAAQTVKWAPRWERNLSYFTPGVRSTVQRIEPPVSKAVQHLENKLPLEKMAKRVDKGIKSGIARFGPKEGSA